MKSFVFALPAAAVAAWNCLFVPPAAAQITPPVAPPPAAPRTATVLVSRALERVSTQNAVTALADSTIAYERIPESRAGNAAIAAPTTASPTPSEAGMEKELNALVKTLPAGTVWVKLYLPTPATGKTWKGDDVADFAFAQARLFGTIGTPSSDGSIEILGKKVAPNAAPPFITGLNLKPLYLVTNTRRGSVTTPWSPAKEQMWGNLSPEQRKQFGEEQATWFLSLPTEQRDQVIGQLKQHDKFFDAVKGPLEKLLGHDI